MLVGLVAARFAVCVGVGGVGTMDDAVEVVLGLELELGLELVLILEEEVALLVEVIISELEVDVGDEDSGVDVAVTAAPTRTLEVSVSVSCLFFLVLLVVVGAATPVGAAAAGGVGSGLMMFDTRLPKAPRPSCRSCKGAASTRSASNNKDKRKVWHRMMADGVAHSASPVLRREEDCSHHCGRAEHLKPRQVVIIATALVELEERLPDMSWGKLRSSLRI